MKIRSGDNLFAAAALGLLLVLNIHADPALAASAKEIDIKVDAALKRFYEKFRDTILGDLS